MTISGHENSVAECLLRPAGDSTVSVRGGSKMKIHTWDAECLIIQVLPRKAVQKLEI